MATTGWIRLNVVRDLNLRCTVLVWTSNQYSSFIVIKTLNSSHCCTSKMNQCGKLKIQKCMYFLIMLKYLLVDLDKLQTKQEQE